MTRKFLLLAAASILVVAPALATDGKPTFGPWGVDLSAIAGTARGGGEPQTFEQVLLSGLAPDGGLYVPDSIPVFSMAEIAGLQAMSANSR